MMQAWQENLSGKGLHVILIYDRELSSGLRVASESCHSADKDERPAELLAAAFPAARQEPGQK